MITTSCTDLANKTFDFVIVGGGTAGLTLAARLSEDSSLTVAVLEAGENAIGDPKITVPAQFGLTLGDTKYDWGFSTTRQRYSNNRRLMWSRGKVLGGSSALNFYAWIKPPAGDIDAFEKLGNPGWNWADYFKYSKKSEKFHVPAKEQTDLYPHTYDLNFRGTSGPIQVTIPPHIHTIDVLFQKTLINMGVKPINDPYGGDISGTWIASSNLDPTTWTRSYSATAYLEPSQNRPNITILTGALTSRIMFANKSGDQELTATGTEFIHEGNTHVVHARKEVILSAGTVNNPQILELSGIGNPAILSEIGVDVRIALPGVGENLQDHNFISVSYELDPTARHETLDLLRDPKYAKNAIQLYTEGKGMLRTGITSFSYSPLSSVNSTEASELIETTRKDIQDYRATPGVGPGLHQQLGIQLGTLLDNTLPDLEIVAFPALFSKFLTPELGKVYVSFLGVLNHPFSRGTIHAKSSDPRKHPEIDPHYFERNSDLENLVQHVKYIRRMASTEPLKSAITGPEVEPGISCATNEQIKEYIKNTHRSAWHGVGTCSMLPLEKQGVVNPQLKVYGTTNLRIVDISIVPIQIAAHTQATAYVIGEKASDIIRSTYSINVKL